MEKKKTTINAAYETTNLYEAAFCLLKGMRLAGKENCGTKTKIFFNPPQDRNGKVDENFNCAEVALSYYHSESDKLFQCYKTVKDFAYRPRPNERE